MFKNKYNSLIGRIKWVVDAFTKGKWFITYRESREYEVMLSTFQKVEEQAIEFPEMLERKEYEWLKNEQLKEYLRSKDFETFMVGVEILKQEGVL